MGIRFLLVALMAGPVVATTKRSSAIEVTWDRAPVHRQTTDRDRDLLHALISVNRFDDAVKLCLTKSRGVDPSGDEAAKWAVWHSHALSSQQLTKDQYSDADMEAAQSPVNQLIQQYPTHPRRLFLDAQRIAVQRDAARHAVIRAAVSPEGTDRQQAAATQLVKVTAALESLAEQAAAEQSRLSGERDAETIQRIADLVRLEQELQVDLVSLALAQTELFPRSSRDAVAAATAAEQTAAAALTKLADGSPARAEIERMRLEAVLRADQGQRADAEWKQWIDAEQGAMSPQLLSPQFTALRVRIDLATDQVSQAASRLAAYYGSAPRQAPRSIEMDLARLEYLLRSERSDEVGPWLDAMDSRGGPYARRRGEAWSLAYLGRSSATGQPAVNPAIVAAQAKNWLRRGEVSRAAKLLAAAAAAETDADRSISRATEAAAAWMSLGSPGKASQVLSDIALSQPSGEGAAAAHLQAAVLAASVPGADAPRDVEAMLRRNLEQWPTGKTAVDARKWLVQLLDRQSRFVDAAVVATRIDVTELDRSELDRMRQAWLTAFEAADDPRSLGALDDALRQAFASLRADSSASGTYRLVAVLVANRATLANLPAAAGEELDWLESLRQFRVSGSTSPSPAAPPSPYRTPAIRRLMFDGRQEPARRGVIASLIQSWGSGSAISLSEVERLLWLNKTSEAIAAAETVIDQSRDGAQTLERAAALLGDSGDLLAQQQALTWWDQLAAGTAKGSSQWHRAKLATIQLLTASGQVDESRRRAKYILLTQPDLSSDLKRRYQAAADPPQ